MFVLTTVCIHQSTKKVHNPMNSKTAKTALLQKVMQQHAYTVKEEAHGPWLTHLSEIATADMQMQMLCNIFPILSLRLMKGSSFEQFLVLKKKNVLFLFFFYYHYYTIYGHSSQWSITV